MPCSIKKEDAVRTISHVLYSQFKTEIDRSVHRALWDSVQYAGFAPKSFVARTKPDGRIKKAKNDHRHWLDEEIGVSPLYDEMGNCRQGSLSHGKVLNFDKGVLVTTSFSPVGIVAPSRSSAMGHYCILSGTENPTGLCCSFRPTDERIPNARQSLYQSN